MKRILHGVTSALALFAVFLGMLACSAPAQAAEPPDVMVKRITREVLEIARSDPDVKTGDRERIYELVESRILPHLDLRRATALTVGHHWRQASEQQRRRLVEEFRALMMHTYAGALSQVGDQELEFQPLRTAPGDTDIVIRFHVLRPHGRQPVQVSYRMYKSPDGWKVYDVNVLGVWLSQTYRHSFSDEIRKGGIDGLIHTLAEKNERLAAQRAAG